MMPLSRRLFAFAAPFALLASRAPLPLQAQENTTDTYTEDEILTATKDFFGDTSRDLAIIIEKVFKDLNGDLPKPTQLIVNLSELLRNWWFIIFPLIGLAIYGVKRWKQTERGRRVWDTFKLRIPMRIGEVVRKVALARFSRTLSSLVSGGVDIIRALEITGATSGNWVVEQSLENVRIKVEEGVPISVPISADPVFPPMVGHMVAVGEETGQLEHMLSKIADFYEAEVDAKVKALTALIEPIMIMFVGGMVGFIVISMYLPLFSIYEKIR